MRSAAVAGFLPSVHGFRFANRWPPGSTVTFGPFDPRVIGIGDAADGLCGGMVATVRDLFEAGVAPPPDAEPPVHGSPRFRWIVRRQVQSLDWLRVPLRYYDLQALRPDPPAGLAALLRREPARVVALRDEWPRIRADIDGGCLSIVGLVRVSGWSPRALTSNHQVLAWAYEEEEDVGGVRLRIYDPNHPGRDDVELLATLDPARSPGEPLGAAAGSAPVDALEPGMRRSRPESVRLAQTTGEPLLAFFRQPYAPPTGTLRAWR